MRIQVIINGPLATRITNYIRSSGLHLTELVKVSLDEYLKRRGA